MNGTLKYKYDRINEKQEGININYRRTKSELESVCERERKRERGEMLGGGAVTR